MAVELAVLDLVRRVAVVRAVDDGHATFPHVLRGALAAMLADHTWRVVVAFDPGTSLRPAVADVVEQAKRWAAERQCVLTVTFRGVPTSPGAAGRR